MTLHRFLTWFRHTQITRAELYVGMVVIVVTTIVGLQVTNYWNNQAQNAAEGITVDAKLRSEKVCSEHNQGDACRALFERLVANVSPAERRALACDVAASLHRPDLARKIDCS